MKPYSLLHCILWLGPLTRREAARVMHCSQRDIGRRMVGQPLHYDGGRIVLGYAPRPERPTVVALRTVLDGDPVYADWLVERTGFERRAVYEALRDLGYESRRGRGAVWVRCEAAK